MKGDKENIFPGRRVITLAALFTGLFLFGFTCQKQEEKPEAAAQVGDLPGQAAPEAVKKMAALVPGKPLVFLYAPDFSGLVKTIVDGPAVSSYLGSEGRKNFEESRLYLKLKVRFEEVSGMFGGEVKFADLRSLAGSESALALYDVGELKFLFLTRMTESQRAATFLWESRGQAQEAQAAGGSYYALSGGASKAKVFFGAAGDWLMLGNDESTFSPAFQRALDPSAPQKALADAPDFNHAFPKDFAVHELAMFLDQTALGDDQYFRRYWLYRNLDDLEWIETAVVDLALRDQAWTETRYYAGRHLPAGMQNRDLAACRHLLTQGIFAECRSLRDRDEAAGLVLSLFGPDEANEKADPQKKDSGSWRVKLGEVLSAGEPSWAGVITGVAWSQDNIFVRFPRSVVIMLDKPGNLDLTRLKKMWAEEWARELTPIPGEPLAWKKDDSGAVLAPPFFPDQALYLDLAGNLLVISSDGGRHRKILGLLKGPAGKTPAFAGVYCSRWDLGQAKEEFSKLENLLGRYPDWPSAKSQSAFEYDFSSLAAALPGQASREIAIEDGLVKETVKAGPLTR